MVRTNTPVEMAYPRSVDDSSGTWVAYVAERIAEKRLKKIYNTRTAPVETSARAMHLASVDPVSYYAVSLDVTG